MSEVGEASQIVIATGRGLYLLGNISLKAALQVAKLINTIWLSKWKGRTFLGRLRSIKGEDMMYLNAGSEDKHELKAIEKEMKAHGILFARMPDLCGGDGRTQYAVSVSEAPKVRALLIDHAMGPNMEIYLGMLSEKDYLSTAFTRDGELTPEFQSLMREREAPSPSEKGPSFSTEYGTPDMQKRDIQNAFEDVRVRMRDLDVQGLGKQYQWISGPPVSVMKNFAEYQLSGDRTVFVPLKDAVLPGNAAGVRNIGAALFRDHSYTVTNLQTGIFQSLAGPVVMAIMKEAAAGRTAPKQTVATREVSKTQTESKVGKGWEGPTSALEGLSNALGRGKTDIPSPFEKTR